MDPVTLGMSKAALNRRRPISRRVVVGADALPSITFDDIPAGYTELHLIGRLRGTRAVTSGTIFYRLNGDAATNYRNQRARANGNTPEATTSAAIDTGWFCEASAATAPADTFSPIDARIAGYDSAGTKTLVADYSCITGSTATSQVKGTMSSTWTNTAAVTSITIFPIEGGFAPGSEVTLYALTPVQEGAPGDLPALIALDGDSLTASATGGGTALDKHLSPKVRNLLTWNKATASQTIVQMNADVATTVDPLYSAGGLCIASCWGGTNDLTRDDTYTPITDPDGAEIYADYVTWLSGRQAVGFQVVAWTITPRTGMNATQQTAIDTFNGLVRTNAATIADSLFDVAAIPALANPADTTYYADGLHQNDAGRELIATEFAAHLAAEYGLTLA